MSLEHDLRAPLAALETALRGMQGVDPGLVGLVRGAAERIRSLADGLTPGGAVAPAPVAAPSSFPVASLDVRPIIERSAGALGPRIAFDPALAGGSALPVADLPKQVLERVLESAFCAASHASVAAAAAGFELRIASGCLPIFGPGLVQALAAAGVAVEVATRIGGSSQVVVRLPFPFAAVLIDDDVWVREAWDWSARRAHLRIEAFSSGVEALSALSRLPRNVPVYIDVNLADEDGLEVAARLHEAGFTEIHLATGMVAESLQRPAWIKSVIGKEPPF